MTDAFSDYAMEHQDSSGSEFIIPSNRKTKSLRDNSSTNKKFKSEEQSTIPFVNRFKPLQMEHIQEEQTSKLQTLNQATNTRKEKVPPIIIEGGSTKDHLKFTSFIKNVVKQEFNIQYTREIIKVFTKTLEDYNLLKSHLQKHKIRFYTYTLIE